MLLYIRMSSLLTKVFVRTIEFGNRWLTLGGLLFKTDENIFVKIEIMVAAVTAVCVGLLLFIHSFPFAVGAVISILLAQRILEYLFVYSRNFILLKGRVFTHFPDENSRGQWIILMFILNLIQILFVFAVWYRFLSFHSPDAFSRQLGILDSLYFSVVTFTTIGYGDIAPVAPLAKILVIIQSMVIFYTLVIVINGLISIQFNRRRS